MGGRWATAYVVIALLAVEALSEGDGDRWSKPAAERRQGDWVPLTAPCLNCRPVTDQRSLTSDSLASVLTPPPRVEDARLFPPPPPDGLFQQAASGAFVQAFEQPSSQVRSKPQQFLQQPHPQLVNKPQAQFLQQPINPSVNSKSHQQFFPQPSSPFLSQQQAAQLVNQQATRQAQRFQLNQQQYVPDNGQFVNQPFLGNTQFLPPQFMHQPNIPSQFLQQINPSQIQQQIPITQNNAESDKQQFQVSHDRPVFLQQITALPPSAPQQALPQTPPRILPQQQHQYVVNSSDNNHQSEEEKEEVQLLYVPVETLKQRGRNIASRSKPITTAPQDLTTQSVVSAETSSLTDNQEYHQLSTRKPHLEDQANFNTQTHNSEHKYRIKQNSQYQQQNEFFTQQPLPTVDQQNTHHFITQQPQIQQQTNLQIPQAQTSKRQRLSKSKQVNAPQAVNLPQVQTFPDDQYSQQFAQEFIQTESVLNANQKPLIQEFNTQAYDQQTINNQYTTGFQQSEPIKSVKRRPTNQDFNTQSYDEQIITKQYQQSFPQKETASNPNLSSSDYNEQSYLQQVVQNQNLHHSSRPLNSNRQAFKHQPVQDYQNIPQYVTSPATPASTFPVATKSTTPAPNQPPLSVYMETTEDSKVTDVLNLLKNAKTIQVLDTVGPDSPQVFVGPSNLNPPPGYIKFELPYLNSLDSNRVERKVDHLPFFVAPLNFNPPPGYSKIPFPAPHIGSVVVSNVTVLKTALHEKPYESDASPSVATESYSDPYTLPAGISPISPQLPSLVNSLQDEIYSVPPTTEPPTTTPETTTVYTTPLYRSRGPSRGSHRGYSGYSSTSTSSPTRRSQPRTRRPYNGRPYSHRQAITTPLTTTAEPTTEASVTHYQQFTSQPEQNSYSSPQHILSEITTPPVYTQHGNVQHSNVNTGNSYFNEEFVADHYNANQFTNNQQQQGNQGLDFTHELQNQNIQPPLGNANQNTAFGSEPQFIQEQPVDTSSYKADPVVHTTAVPTVPSFQGVRDDNSFKSQRTTTSRREPPSRYQRFRSRQRTTTTTESYSDPAEGQYGQSQDFDANYQETPSRNQYRHQQQQSSQTQQSTDQKYLIQTERVGIDYTTQSPVSDQYEQKYNQQTINIQQSNNPINPDNQYYQQTIQPQRVKDIKTQDLSTPAADAFQQSQFEQVHAHNKELPQQSNNNQQNYFQSSQVAQQNTQSIHTVDQRRPSQHKSATQTQVQTNYNQDNFEQAPASNVKSQAESPNVAQQNYFDQNPNQQQNEQQAVTKHHAYQQVDQEQYTNAEKLLLLAQAQSKDPVGINDGLNIQNLPSQFEQTAEVTSTLPQQEPVVQNFQHVVSQSPSENDEASPEYNQQHLVKYTRSRTRNPITTENYASEDQTQTRTENFRRGQYQSEDAIVNTPETTIVTTTKSPLVRVRGHVRSRQRGSVRNYHSTTTETPNYPPNTFQSRTRNSQARDQITDYSSQKRGNPNYSSRQTYSSLRNNNNKLSVVEEATKSNNEYVSTEQPSTTEKYTDYSDVTSTTEESTTKIARRYKHILNRNKVRRTRPATTPSGSSGTTKFLVPTTQPPVTRLPNGRGRIRKPVSITTTTSTTEYPRPLNQGWGDGDNLVNNFAPSAGSNEILEPYYVNNNKAQQSFSTFQRTPQTSLTPVKTTAQPAVRPAHNDDYWNQAITIQQSTSFDFKPEISAVTPPSFQTNNGQFQGSFPPVWDGQIELQDGNYYDAYHVQAAPAKGSSSDQTPFSSNQQRVVYTEIRGKQTVGKENQWTEKPYHDSRKHVGYDEEEPTKDIYPVYKETIKPAETIQEETAHAVESVHDEQKTPTASHKEQHHGETVAEESNTSTEGTDPLSGDGLVKSDVRETEDDIKVRTVVRPVNDNKPGRRRGNWVRVRVRKPQDMFETAESQNLASLSENAIQAATKPVREKVPWTSEPTTEISTTEPVSEPEETINFEDALTDMLKEFISKPEDTTESEEQTDTTTTESTLSEIKNTTLISDTNLTKENFVTKQSEDVVKIVTSETTTEVGTTPESTTIFQPVDMSEGVETTTESDVTTTTNEQLYETQPPRILGTSTTTEISLETEICYRGRCVKTKKRDSESDLLTAE